jgi:DNA-binding HxlR family transcriptional regulator
VHVQYVRDRLKTLAQIGLVERGGWGDSARWGDWRLTPHGLEALLAHDQLRLTT